MPLRRLILGPLAAAVLMLLPVSVGRAAPPPTPGAPLVVGTKATPPFVVMRADGSFGGPSIHLWREIAQELQLTYRFEERDLDGLLTGLQDGTLDVSVAAITVTSERERVVDFSHPFHTAGLAIAIQHRERSIWRTVASTMFSSAVLLLLAGIAAMQLVVGTVVWALERRQNPSEFGGNVARGLFSGFWWSTVTMTTVGYGDKAPVTIGGRVVALGWMLLSVVMVATLTATAASKLTVAELEVGIAAPDDLVGERVAVVAGTTGERYARGAGLDFARYRSPELALAALAEGSVAAVVHDGPVLMELVDAHASLRVLPVRFQRQDYAIAVPENSALRETINRVLPERVRQSGIVDARVIP